MAMNQSVTLILNSKRTHSPALIVPNVIRSFKQLSLPFEVDQIFADIERACLFQSVCLLVSTELAFFRELVHVCLACCP